MLNFFSLRSEQLALVKSHTVLLCTTTVLATTKMFLATLRRRSRQLITQRQLTTTATKPSGGDKDGWSLNAKLALAAAFVVVPTGISVSVLRSDPELRADMQLKYPEVYGLAHNMIPGGLEDVTMAQVLAKKNDWPLEHELPWGEGYDEDFPPRTAVVTTKRGTKFTVELVATDQSNTIIPKLIPAGASYDDEVLDVQFVSTASSGNQAPQSSLSAGMEQQRNARVAKEGMTKEQLRQRLEEVRDIERRMKVDREVWANMGPNGIGKVQEYDQELWNVENEKVQIKKMLQ